MIGAASASTLRTTGGSISCGRLAAAAPTRSRTSLAALSILRPGANSMVMSDWPSREREVIVCRPSSPASCSSSTWVIRVSMTLAAAPI